MAGKPIKLAISVCYAVAKALENHRGLSLGITSFPVRVPEGIGVQSILSHGGRLNRRMKVSASGDTPLGAALYWVMQEMRKRKEERKIILILSDGCPTDRNLAVKALAELGKYGFEVYGLGLKSNAIAHLIPGRTRFISNMTELAPALFGLLAETLI